MPARTQTIYQNGVAGKFCSRCKTWRPLDEGFHVCGTYKKDGKLQYASACKICLSNNWRRNTGSTSKKPFKPHPYKLRTKKIKVNRKAIKRTLTRSDKVLNRFIAN